MPTNLVRIIIPAPKKAADGMFVQPTDVGSEREMVERSNRLNFAHNFFYADPLTGNIKTYDPKGDYNCGRCNKEDDQSCLIIPIRVNPDAGSCKCWTGLDAGQAEIDLTNLTTAEAVKYGVAENGKGFGCSRCPMSEKAVAQDSVGRDLYCRIGDFRVFSTACCEFNGAAVVNDYEDNTPIKAKKVDESTFKKEASEDDGAWITVNGSHVHINGEGNIDKGPEEFVGKKPDELGVGEEGSRTNPVDCGDDIEKAAKLISQGKHVSLNQPDEVSTLVEKIRTEAQEAIAKGENPPTWNIADISIKGTNLFAVDNLEIPRIEMPQFAGTVVPGSKAAALLPDNAPRTAEVDLTTEFLTEMHEQGIKSEDVSVLASHLRATQNELDGAKVGGIAHAMDEGKVREAAIVVTRDNYILDGHHRWAANIVRASKANSLDTLRMPVHRLDMDIGTALTKAKDFTKSWGLEFQTLTGRTGKVIRYIANNAYIRQFEMYENYELTKTVYFVM